MSSLRALETSPNGNSSVSNNMTQNFVREWCEAHLGGAVVVRDAKRANAAFVTAPSLQAYFTPNERRTAAIREAIFVPYRLIVELLEFVAEECAKSVDLPERTTGNFVCDLTPQIQTATTRGQ